jgi:hypothetical protein
MEIKKENVELRNKIMAGIKKATEKLFEHSAANNEKLVISDENGKVKIVFARDLILSLRK